MKIKLDKEYTMGYQFETVKKAMADFKGYFTDDDLVRMYRESFEEIPHSESVVECNVKAFSSNCYDDNTTFQIDILTKVAYLEYHELHFYIYTDNGSYVIDQDDLLHHDHTFKFAC